MKDTEEFTAKMNLPPVTQIAIVVRDMEQSLEYYSKTFGLGPFEPSYEFAPDKSWYMGTEAPLRLLVSRTPWGTMEFEVLQPLGGPSIHQDFLDTHGEGLHHLGIEVEDYDGIVSNMDRAGFKPIQALETYLPKRDCWAKAAYFDTHKIGGIILEIMWRPWLHKK